MKNTIILILLLTTVVFTDCKKDKEEEKFKPPIADIEYVINDLRVSTDSTFTDVTFPNSLLLKSDYTWLLDCNGAKSNGTYTWIPTLSNRADIRFTILQFTPLNSNITVSNKIKTILETCPKAVYDGPGNVYFYLLDDFSSNALRATKK